MYWITSSIAGVSEFSYFGVSFRGFHDSGNVFYDGVCGDPYTGFGVPQLFNVERVEVLKGSAAALYGGGEPGGNANHHLMMRRRYDLLQGITAQLESQ